MSVLTSTKQVIDELGGISAVAELTGRKYGAAAQWPHFATFPSNTYLVMTGALAARGLSAPASLWGMTTPERVMATQARWPS